MISLKTYNVEAQNSAAETFEEKVLRWFDLAQTEYETYIVQSVILGAIRTPGKRALVISLGNFRRDVLRKLWA